MGILILGLFLLIICGVGAYVLQMICGIVASEEVELFPCGLTCFLATILSIVAIFVSAYMTVAMGAPDFVHWILSLLIATGINATLIKAVIKLQWKPSLIVGASLHVCIMLVWMFFGSMAR